MQLKNTTTQLISINMPLVVDKDKDGKVVNVQQGECYNIMPAGPSVEVPDEVSEFGFVKALIETGELIVTAEPKAPAKTDDGLDDMTDEELIEYADGIDLKRDGRWKRDRLIEEIRNAG